MTYLEGWCSFGDGVFLGVCAEIFLCLVAGRWEVFWVVGCLGFFPVEQHFIFSK